MLENIILNDIKIAIEIWGEDLDEQVKEWHKVEKNTDTHSLQTAPIQIQTLQTLQAIQNLKQSSVQFKLFLTKLAPHLRPDFMPSVTVDNEGEFIFEWYGRQGARASVIVGANGALYFVSLFHGTSIKSRLLWNNDIPPLILTELDKIYKDKQA